MFETFGTFMCNGFNVQTPLTRFCSGFVIHNILPCHDVVGSTTSSDAWKTEIRI